MRFIRKNGRIIPIRESSSGVHKSGVDYKSAATAGAGAALSIVGSAHVQKIASRFLGKKSGVAAMLGTVFAGEYIASGASDKFTESLRLGKNKEQRVKNVTAGSLGVLGAISALRSFR